MNRQVRLILLDDAEIEYQKLNKIVGDQIKNGNENTFEIQLLKSINQKKEFLKNNPFYGDNISKNKIPKNYLLKYKASNLWRIELTNYWRMLYTIKGDQVEIICFILDIVDHNDYNKILGYKKK